MTPAPSLLNVQPSELNANRLLYDMSRRAIEMLTVDGVRSGSLVRHGLHHGEVGLISGALLMSAQTV